MKILTCNKMACTLLLQLLIINLLAYLSSFVFENTGSVSVFSDRGRETEIIRENTNMGARRVRMGKNGSFPAKT